MTKTQRKAQSVSKTLKATRPSPVRAADPATRDTRAVRFGTGCISPSLRKRA
jgi:hypothetical protein